MSKLMGWLRDAMASIRPADIMEPPDDIQEGDEVIGVLESPDLRRMNTVRLTLTDSILEMSRKLARDAEDLITEKSRSGREDDGESVRSMASKALREIESIIARKSAIDNLFWAALREELPPESQEKVDKKSGDIGIRKGWQIVAIPQEPEPEISIGGLGFGMPPFGILLGAMCRK